MAESKLSFNGQLVDDSSDDVLEHKVGQYFFLENSEGKIVGISICLPMAGNRGCSFGGMDIVRTAAEKKGTACWIWNGSIEKPTLTPSINWKGHWHGYLTNGRFTSVP